MKVLLLLSGYTCKRVSGAKGDYGSPKPENMNDFFTGAKYLKKLLKHHQVKTICCLWDEIGINEVRGIYNPEILISLNQDKFQDKLSNRLGDYEIRRMQKRNKWFKEKNIKNDLVISTARIASQLYGRQVVSKKALEFLDQKDFTPDLIFLTRYDISCRGGLFIRNPSKISPKIEKFLIKDQSYPKVVMPLFNQLNAGLPDMWFYLNYLGLQKMQNIYNEYLDSITDDKSEYKNFLTNGWPFSEYFNLADTNDPKQFSNIMLLKKETPKLMQYKDWELPNIHAFLKYFFILKKIKFKIKFVSRFDSLFSMILYGSFRVYFFLNLRELMSGLKSKLKNFLNL